MPTRRTFLKSSGAALSAALAAKTTLLSPAGAHAQAAPLTALTQGEGEALAAFGELIVPGAAAAGVAHYVDQQLAAPPHESMLMLKYLGAGMPAIDFYRQSLAALEGYALAKFGAKLSELAATDGMKLADAVFAGTSEPWTDAPPSPFVFFALRADATDVVYGTVAGFSRIGQAYRPHIAPPYDWS